MPPPMMMPPMPPMGMMGPPTGAAQNLPPPLLALFAPRPPLPFLGLLEKAKPPPYTGLAAFTKEFEDPKTVDYSQFTTVETRTQRKDRIIREQKEKNAKAIAEKIKECKFCTHFYYYVYINRGSTS